MAAKCPSCGSDKLQISMPVWFRYTGRYDTTYSKDEIIDVDIEADGDIWCEDCETHHEESDFPDPACGGNGDSVANVSLEEAP